MLFLFIGCNQPSPEAQNQTANVTFVGYNFVYEYPEGTSIKTKGDRQDDGHALDTRRRFSIRGTRGQIHKHHRRAFQWEGPTGLRAADPCLRGCAQWTHRLFGSTFSPMSANRAVVSEIVSRPACRLIVRKLLGSCTRPDQSVVAPAAPNGRAGPRFGRSHPGSIRRSRSQTRQLLSRTHRRRRGCG